MTRPLQRDASRFIHALSFETLPDSVVLDAQRRLLDLIGIAAAGTTTKMSRIAREHALDCFGAGRVQARMMFDGRQVSAAGAAFSGAATIDSFDGHDGHVLTKGHVGVTVLPTLLAIGDSVGEMSGREFLTQLVLGYEVGTRAGIALHATSSEYHTSGAWNALAAAGVASRAMRLDIDATRHALGIAEYHGPRSDMMRCIEFPTMLKDGSSWGAMAGISAAFLASRGFTGAPATTVEREAPDCWHDLGQRWLITEQYVKPYPVCRWAHPAITAAMRIRARSDFSPDQIGSVHIETFDQASKLWSGMPVTTEEAQYGLLFPVAAALQYGAVDADTIGDAGLSDHALLDLVNRMSAVSNEDFSRAFPAERWAKMTVHLRNGRMLTSDPVQATGDPSRPMGQDAELDKFYRLVRARFSGQLADRIFSEVQELADAGSSSKTLCDLLLRHHDGTEDTCMSQLDSSTSFV